jgi:hypothetical protein
VKLVEVSASVTGTPAETSDLTFHSIQPPAAMGPEESTTSRSSGMVLNVTVLSCQS